MTGKTPIILDCTLRDGSYVLDFQFSVDQTKNIASELYKANFQFIEVGHGIGIGASKKGLGIAAASDSEYCKAANSVVGENSDWGMFCIPGIATLEDLEMVIDENIKFIRIGSDVTKIHESEKFIKLAKKKGIKVFANFMKSYVVKSKDFAKLVSQSLDYGVDGVYIVDSAGGMIPNKLKGFIRDSFSLNPGVTLGFHGHNNLGLGMANALTAIEEGVQLIDSSVQGFGRSAGNVYTEHLVCLLDILKLNNNKIDPIKVMNIGETLIRPLIREFGMSSLDITSGWALFHSSFIPSVLEFSEKNNVDPRLFIYELCKKDKINISNNLFKEVLKKINKNQSSFSKIKKWPSYFGEEELKI